MLNSYRNVTQGHLEEHMSKFFNEHQLLVMGGKMTAGDIWTCSMKTCWGALPGVRMSFADQEQVLRSVDNPPFIGLWSKVSAWFLDATTGPQFNGINTLEWVKFNSIATNGKYAYPDTSIYTYATPIPGPATTGGDPRQSVVITMRAAYDRGRGSYGRIYPPRASFNYADGQATLADAPLGQYLGKFNTLVAAINSITVDGGNLQVVNISPGDTVTGRAALTAPVTRLQADWVQDTQRRRTNKVPRHIVTVAV